MTPATAYLTFTAARLAKEETADDLYQARRALGFPTGDDLLRQLDRAELARRASGLHEREVDALAYARREGPAVVLAPDGRVFRVERARDAALDAAAAAEERDYSKRLGRLTFREAIAS
jgi:hypothetical protein